jgi:hypothetical protein
MFRKANGKEMQARRFTKATFGNEIDTTVKVTIYFIHGIAHSATLNFTEDCILATYVVDPAASLVEIAEIVGSVSVVSTNGGKLVTLKAGVELHMVSVADLTYEAK